MGIFRAFSISTEGASHKKSNQPCQDASLDNDTDDEGNIAIAVVADGHGSPQYFRSDIGSKAVADVVANGIKVFHFQCSGVSARSAGAANSDNSDVVVDTVDTASSDNSVSISDAVKAASSYAPEAFLDGSGKRMLDRLAKHVISSWYTCVSDDEISNPLIIDERIAAIEDKYQDRYLNDPERQYFCHAYGTTLIAVAMAEEYWFGLQIGDGKCVVLYEDGSWDQPIPWDDKCFLNSTTSICDDDAINEFRYWFGFRQADGTIVESRYGVDGQDKDETNKSSSKPVAIFIGTDGVDDTFPIYENEKHLMYLYRNIILKYADKGYDVTKEQILELAKKMAEQGSQDDVSIAGIISSPDLQAGLIEKLYLHNEADIARDKADAARKSVEAMKQALQAEQSKTDSIKQYIENLKINTETELQAAEDEAKAILKKQEDLENEIANANALVSELEEQCRVCEIRLKNFTGSMTRTASNTSNSTDLSTSCSETHKPADN